MAAAPDLLPILEVTAPPGRKLTAADWTRVEQYLDEWQSALEKAVATHPAKSFELGVDQVNAYLELVGKLSVLGIEPEPVSESQIATVDWLKRVTLTEVQGALAKYRDAIHEALMHGVQGNVNPTQLASWLYHKTKDAEVNWRLIARTEMIRANSAGRLAASRAQGFEKVWVPPHTGSCAQCRRLLENKVFLISDVENVSNFDVPAKDWKACIPLHPQCRHSWLPYDPEVYDVAQDMYRNVEDAFADIDMKDKKGKQMTSEQKINEMFDSSGQLKPEYEEGFDWSRFKEHDPYQHALAATVAKVRRRGGRVPASRRRRGDEDIGKGFFDPEQEGYDPLLFDGSDLRTDVRDRVVEWWRHVFGPDAPLWSHIFITGGATSRQYLPGAVPEQDPDVDLQIVVDYPELRDRHRGYAKLSDPEIHSALVTRLKAGLEGWDVVPGVALDAFIRPEQTLTDFDAVTALMGQDVWDVARGRWRYQAPVPKEAEVVTDGPILEGMGGETAIEHPEWVTDAQATASAISALLNAYETGDGESGALESAYRLLHDARARSFRPGGGGQEGRGNFIWQYLTNFGRLMELKHAVIPEDMGKVMPDYAWSVPEPGEWTVAKEWPLPVGATVRLLDGPQIIASRLRPGVYSTIDGTELHHHAILDVAKQDEPPHADKAPAKADQQAWQPGVEHWITVHPNGPDDKGTPVLVRNAPSREQGMSVIGGAGGHLNYLRIHPGARIKPPKGEEPSAPDEGLGPVEQPLSEEEAAQQEQEHQQRLEAATKVIDQSNEQSKLVQSQLNDYMGEIGINLATKHVTHLSPEGEVTHEEDIELSAKEKKKLLKQVFDSAIHVNTYGELSSADAAQGYEMKQSVKEKPTEPPGEETPEEQREPLKPTEQADIEAHEPSATLHEPKAKVALSGEEAEEILRLRKQLQKIAQTKRKASQVIAGQASAPDAYTLDWSDADISEAVAKDAEARQRTDIARELLMTGEEALTDPHGKARSERSPIRRALRQGAFDSFDALSDAVAGRSLIPPNVSRLLGIAGTAQLLGHYFREQAAAGKLDLDDVLDAMNDITDEREGSVLGRALTRAKDAAEEAVQSRKQRQLSEKGESDWTTTATRSRETRKLNEAANALGYSIAGQEAFSAMKVALGRDTDRLQVQGFTSPSQISELAQKAGLDINPTKDISKVGTANYQLSVDPARLDHLFEIRPRPDEAQRQTLQDIREADDDSDLIQNATSTPGMSQTLKPSQARGKLALLQMGSGILAMDPGVGKTHTAVAAAMQLMHDEPDKHHRVLVIAPETALGQWADVVSKQGSGHSVQIMGQKYQWDPQGGAEGRGQGMRTGTASTARATKQAQTPADFNVVSFDMMARNPELMKGLGSTIVVFDEAQKLKNPDTNRFRQAHEVAGNAEHRYMLTGTAVEKRVGDLQSQLAFVNPTVENRQAFEARYGATGQREHIGREEKVGEFREQELDPYLLHVSAASGSKLPTSNLQPSGLPVDTAVKLGPKHRAAFRAAVKYVNDEQARRRAAGEKPMPFGGQDYLASVLRNGHDPEEGNALAKGTVDQIDGQGGFDYEDKDFGGQHSGHFEHKTVVFDKYVNGTKPLQQELDKRGYIRWKKGMKLDSSKRYYFMANGSEPNDDAIAAFKEHQGKGVLLSTDKNSTARDFQFGVSNGQFQYGATRMIHYSLPDNPAEIHQRQARILRNGSRVPVEYQAMTANMPHEINQRERLEGENRLQGLIGNSEGLIPDLPAPAGYKGEEERPEATTTMRQRLRAKGQQTVAEQEEAESAAV